MKKPRLERGPKLNRAIAQPQTMITSGVRQLAAAGNRRRSPSVAVIQVPRSWARITVTHECELPATRCGTKLMHRHGNPNPDLAAQCSVANSQVRAAPV